MLEQSQHDLKNLLADVLAQTLRMGLDAAELSLGQQSGHSVTLRLNAVETIEFNQDKRLGITVYKGKHKGSASTTDLSPRAVQDCLEAAASIASRIESDPFGGLIEKEYVATQQIDCDLYHPSDISIEQSIEMARACEEAARAFDARIVNSEGSTFNASTHHRVYGNTHGFVGAYSSTSYGLSMSALAKEGDSMERDYDFTVARDAQDLLSSVVVGQGSARKALARLHARKIKTMEAPVIFAPEVARSLVAHLIDAISGGSLYRKTSFLLDNLHKPIFPDFVQIKTLPHQAKGLGSAPFDGEGVATQERFLVQDGVLEGYVLGGYSARRLGLKTTGNCGGIQNVLISQSAQPTIAAADLNQEALLKAMGRGLLVTELMGHGINPVTGDYSRGVFGFWVEHGQIQYPVHEVTIAGNLKTMYAGLVAVGSDIDRRSKLLTGSLWIDRMTIAGE